MMPSPYTAQMSLDDSREMVRRLGVPLRRDRHRAGDEHLRCHRWSRCLPICRPTAWPDTTPENIQARIRGMMLMALSNRTGCHRPDHRQQERDGGRLRHALRRHGRRFRGHQGCVQDLRLSPGPLSQYARSDVIPENIITRPPSAELKPGQTDQDTLPPYEVLDAIIEAYMERDHQPARNRRRSVTARPTCGAWSACSRRNEYKRRQSPVGIRVSRRGFGKDWRYPITSRYSDEW